MFGNRELLPACNAGTETVIMNWSLEGWKLKEEQ